MNSKHECASPQENTNPQEKVRLLLSYDGSSFHGWQRQTSGHETIQEVLERVLYRLFGQRISVMGSGRTDAGVHAVGQVVHFLAPKPVAGFKDFRRSLNALLPESIAVKQAWLAPQDFHALASAVSKTYIYRLWNHPVRSPLWNERAWWIHYPLDLERLSQMAQVLVGTHDFASFQTRGSDVTSTIRTLTQARWLRRRGPLLEFHITGNGFLKQMVRNIVGTLIHLHNHQRGPEDLRRILLLKDRRQAKTTAPAHGLYLFQVKYPTDLDKKCRKL